MTITQKRLNALDCVLGLDCSKYQKDINWEEAKAGGIEFAFIKITEGTTYSEDELYNVQARAAEAKEQGVKIGYYHFARPGNEKDAVKDAKDEIANIAKHLTHLPQANFPIVIDLESYAKDIVWDDKIKHMVIYLDTLITELRNKYKMSPIIYSYSSFLNSNLKKEKIPEYVKNGNILWLAAYVKNPGLSLPVLPIGWDSWKIWQFTDKGQISGYSGDIDLNVMKKDLFNIY